MYNKKASNLYLSIITLNVNGLHFPIKRHTGAEWIRKQGPYTAYKYTVCKKPSIDRKTNTDWK